MSADRPNKRVAMLGLMLESNSFAPKTEKDDFLNRLYVAGSEFFDELRKTESKLPTELRAFYAAMNNAVDWVPLPILIGLVEAGGPSTTRSLRDGRRDGAPADSGACRSMAVYICNHGAMITTENRDPDATIFAMVPGSSAPRCRSSRRSTCMATSRTAWSRLSTPSSPIAPIRMSTWSHAAGKRLRRVGRDAPRPQAACGTRPAAGHAADRDAADGETGPMRTSSTTGSRG